MIETRKTERERWYVWDEIPQEREREGESQFFELFLEIFVRGSIYLPKVKIFTIAFLLYLSLSFLCLKFLKENYFSFRQKIVLQFGFEASSSLSSNESFEVAQRWNKK